jgi:ATP-dependent Clp protease adaptor protein ClpS
MPISTPDTETDVQTATDVKEDLMRPWQVIVHNDPVNTFAYVTMVFKRIFGYNDSLAKKLTNDVHYTGKATVWTGAREKAEHYVQELHRWQLNASLQADS